MSTRDQEHRVVDQDSSVTTGESGGAEGRLPGVSTGAVLPVDKDCTCGEPPYTGHFLWCESLRGRPEFRPLGATTDESGGADGRVLDVSTGLKRSNWTNGRPFTVTDEMMSSPWNGYRDGRTFRCHMCGEFFKPGGVARFVWCNGVKEAREAGVHCGNVMVCDACDGPDIYVRLAEHEQFGQKRYWSLRDYERLPPNPHSPPTKIRRRHGIDEP